MSMCRGRAAQCEGQTPSREQMQKLTFMHQGVAVQRQVRIEFVESIKRINSTCIVYCY